MKKICILLCFILIIFSCEKYDDEFIPIADIPQRITSKKQYTNGVLVSKEDYKYDNYGRLISLVKNYIDEYGEPGHSFERNFEYEQNKIIEYPWGYNPGVFPAHKTEREIDNGTISKIYSYKWNGEVWDIESRESYIFNEAKKLSRWNKIYFGLFQGMVEGEIIYEDNLPKQKFEKRNYYDFFYDLHHKSTNYQKEIFSYADGWLQNITFHFKWDDTEDWVTDRRIEYQRSGREIKEITYRFSQEEVVVDWITITTYNEHGNIIKTKSMYSYSDYEDVIISEYEDKPGNWEVVLEDPV